MPDPCLVRGNNAQRPMPSDYRTQARLRRRLVVHGLPLSASWRELLDFAREKVVPREDFEVQYALVFKDPEAAARLVAARSRKEEKERRRKERKRKERQREKRQQGGGEEKQDEEEEEQEDDDEDDDEEVDKDDDEDDDDVCELAILGLLQFRTDRGIKAAMRCLDQEEFSNQWEASRISLIDDSGEAL